MQRLIIQQIFCWIERDRRMSDGKIKNSEELEFAVREITHWIPESPYAATKFSSTQEVK